MKTTVIKRSEIFKRVWERPMIHVGTELGVSGNGLKKICIRHDIPRPPAGYFAMNPAKRKRHERGLPNPQEDPEITITGEEDERQETDFSQIAIPETHDPAIAREIDDYVRELRANPRIDERGICQPKDQGPDHLIRCPKEKIGVVAERLKAILSSLKANGCEIEFRARTHYRYDKPTKEVRAILGKAEMALRVEETATRKERPMTPKELKERRSTGSDGWFYRSDPWIYTPTGKVLLIFDYSRRRTIGEDIRPIVTDVLDLLKERNEREIQWEIEERKERAQELLELRPMRRELWRERQFKSIEKEAKAWARAERLRHYIGAVSLAEDGPEVSEWLNLAKELIDDLDPIGSGTFAQIVDLPKYKEVQTIWKAQKDPFDY